MFKITHYKNFPKTIEVVDLEQFILDYSKYKESKGFTLVYKGDECVIVYPPHEDIEFIKYEVN